MKSLIKHSVVFTFVAVIVSVCGVLISIASPVIKVGAETQLRNAALACPDGGSIILVSDIHVDETLIFDCEDKSISIDLAGHRLEIVDSRTNAIAVKGNGTLIIKDSDGTGRLSAECSFVEGETTEDTAGINVGEKQTLIVDGAELNARGGVFGAGIGGSLGPTGTIIVKSGVVTSEGGIYGAGIGGGFNQYSGNIMIEGGRIEAKGGIFGAGIGTGGFDSFSPAQRNDKIVIKNGNITATGGVNAAGIGGGQYQGSPVITIIDGKTNAHGGDSGAGIGSGYLNTAMLEVAGEAITLSGSLSPSGVITISGGNIKAVGGKAAAGIGTGEGRGDFSTELMLSERMIKLEGGNVYACGGSGGAGIGGGAYMTGGTVEIEPSLDKSVDIEAHGGAYGAGIGGGKGGASGHLLSIKGGRITASGGDYASGIGTGGFTREHIQPTGQYYSECKNVSITGGQVNVSGGKDAAAIGGGSGGAGVILRISGTPVVEAVSMHETTIGAGRYSMDHGECVVNGGNVSINRGMGPRPALAEAGRNSKNYPTYRATLTVVTEDSKMPAAGALIEAITDDAYTYSAVTDKNGMVSMYLPAGIVGISVKPSDGSLRNRLLRSIEVTPDDKCAGTLEMVNDEPLKILSKTHTYYTGDDNTFLLKYIGGVNETTEFSIINNECGVTIDKKSGLVTIPVQIKPGEHVFTLNASKDRLITDSCSFTLKVVDSLTAIDVGPRYLITETGNENLIHMTARPNTAEINYSNWRVIYGTGEDCTVREFIDDSGERYFSFTGEEPGDYTLLLAAQDTRGNKVWETVSVNVFDPDITVFSDLFENIEGVSEESGGEVMAWSVDRTGPETAKVIFDFSGAGDGTMFLTNDGRTVYQENMQLKKGRNAIDLCDLSAGIAYDCYIKIIDEHGEANSVGSFFIPDFVEADILPPVLTEIEAVRSSGDTASVSFTSDEPGKFSYFFSASPEGRTSPFTALYEGKNKILLDDLISWDSYELKLITEDEYGNWSDIITIDIPEYKKSGGIKPVLTSGWAVRQSESTAMIGFDTTLEGECFYTFVRLDKDTASSENLSLKISAVEGGNEFIIDALPSDEPYDLYARVKSSSTGEESGILKIRIGAWTEEPKTVCGLEAGNSIGVGSGLAYITFKSNADGEYFYSIVPGGEPLPVIAQNQGSYEMSEGENIISLTDLLPGKGYVICVAGKTENGYMSEPIQMEIVAKEKATKKEIKFV